MKTPKFDKNNVVLLGILIATSIFYFFINHPTSHLHILKNSLDNHISFMPIFVIPYLIFLPAFWLTIFYAFWRQQNFKQLAITILIVYAVSYISYLLFQTYVPRSMVYGHDVFSRLVGFVYRVDKPYNGFPSGHSSGATIMAAYFIFTNSRWRWLAVVFGIVVVVSTLFIKQHFILDAVSGVGLGAVVSYIVFRSSGSRNSLVYEKRKTKL